jgi:hypothetical protein
MNDITSSMSSGLKFYLDWMKKEDPSKCSVCGARMVGSKYMCSDCADKVLDGFQTIKHEKE